MHANKPRNSIDAFEQWLEDDLPDLRAALEEADSLEAIVTALPEAGWYLLHQVDRAFPIDVPAETGTRLANVSTSDLTGAVVALGAAFVFARTQVAFYAVAGTVIVWIISTTEQADAQHIVLSPAELITDADLLTEIADGLRLGTPGVR